MKVLTGTAASGGVAEGTVHFFVRRRGPISDARAGAAESEFRRYAAARDEAVAELQEIYEKAVREVGEEEAEIFQISSMMLIDDDFNAFVRNSVESENASAERAVENAAVAFSEMLNASGSDYIAGRSSDVRDVCGRVVELLSGSGRDLPPMAEPGILAADDLLPSETMRLDRSKILAIVTARGTVTSHTSILARSMNIPAVVGIGAALDDSCSGKKALVDGFGGKVYIEPAEDVRRVVGGAAAAAVAEKADLEKFRGTENRTRGGRLVGVWANAGGLSDIELAVENDAGGIGLFRSEFLYLGKTSYPTEEELFETYRSAAVLMRGRTVILRTLDIGADKSVDYFGLPEEENPALGHRAIRVCLARPELFRTQLRAILRASAFGNVSVMFPMIVSVAEFLRARGELERAMNELDAAGAPFNRDIETGVMIETPAAAILSDQLAREADFFSIGTNDLSQYTLAADRGNPAMQGYFDPPSEAVLRIIEMTVRNARDNGIRVGICGELGADLSLTDRFLEMGVDEFSVNPGSVLPLRRAIRNSTLA